MSVVSLLAHEYFAVRVVAPHHNVISSFGAFEVNRMNKVEEKKRAIAEVAELMKAYTEYVESVKNQPFTDEIREQLRTRAEKIRWLQQGLESGYYER